MKTIDLTNGRTPKTENGEEYGMTVEFHTGSRYIYYGPTKRECEKNFRSKFGNFRGFIKKEWTIE